MGPGDTLACYKLDRVGRSLAHLSKLLDDLSARGIRFKTVSDGLDTSGSTGRLVLHMLAAVAQFERDLIVERTRAGLAAAKKSGKKFGAPVKWTPEMAAKAKGYFEKGLNGDEVARQLKVSRRTLFRGLRVHVITTQRLNFERRKSVDPPSFREGTGGTLRLVIIECEVIDKDVEELIEIRQLADILVT